MNNRIILIFFNFLNLSQRLQYLHWMTDKICELIYICKAKISKFLLKFTRQGCCRLVIEPVPPNLPSFPRWCMTASDVYRHIGITPIARLYMMYFIFPESYQIIFLVNAFNMIVNNKHYVWSSREQSFFYFQRIKDFLFC